MRSCHGHTWKIFIYSGLKGTCVGYVVNGYHLTPRHGHIWIIHIKCGLQGTFVGNWVRWYHLRTIPEGIFAWCSSRWMELFTMSMKKRIVLTVLRILPLGVMGRKNDCVASVTLQEISKKRDGCRTTLVILILFYKQNITKLLFSPYNVLEIYFQRVKLSHSLILTLTSYFFPPYNLLHIFLKVNLNSSRYNV